MNKEKIISDMISFIENEEKNFQAANFAAESKTSKNEIVNTILKQLDHEVENDN